MTSPSSSIVVVDKSGSVDASNLIQSSQHVHQAQHQPIRAQQVILNEEYLSSDNIVRAGNVNYLIPMPSSTAPMIKPSSISQHPNSKVHVISNVTLVSKADQTQPQTINFVNNKHLQASSGQIGNRASITGGNYVNISTKSQIQNKMFKSPAITQIDQQTHIISSQQQQTQQQPHIITKHLNNASAIVQKVIPRNILVSTGRIQNKIEPATIARTTPMAQHQSNQAANIIQIQKSNAIAINKTSSLNVNNIKSTKANQQAIKLVNQTIGGVGGSTATSVVKHGSAGAVKTMTNTTISALSNQSAIQQKNQTKISYGIQNAKNPHQPLQQKSQLTSVHSNISAHRNNNNNNNTINANTKPVQHPTQRTLMSMNNVCVQPNVIGQKMVTTKSSSSNKYITPNISNINQTAQASCMSTVHYRTNESLQGNEQRVTTYRTIQPTEVRQTSVAKSITMMNHPVNISSEGGQQSIKKDTEWNQFRHRNGVEIGYHDFQHDTKSASMPNSVDDVIMVNGTHMSEEMSARILQSLSQKVVFHSNNSASNSNTPNITSGRTIQSTQSHRPLQSNSHRAIQPAPYNQLRTPRSYVEYANKSGPEYFRVNTSDIQSTTSTFVDNIPLVSTRGDESFSNANDLDDDIIGEEVRPKPIDSSMDAKMQALHALLQDHTYVQWPQMTVTTTSFASNSSSAQTGTSTASADSNVGPSPSNSLLASPSTKAKSSSTNQTIENSATGNSAASLTSQTTILSTPNNKSQPQSNTAPLIPGYPFGYNVIMNKDDDSNSAISNGSRNKSDIDQGEETETAPEAGNEDDSVTRCICDLSHDDGYMICCDKCSVWQHVDCMGIDRQNIPEEYKCELCQPREIDQNRARTLQLMKRKEQQNFLMMKQSNQSSGFPSDSATSQSSNANERSQLNAFSTIVANKKKGTLSSKSRKGDLFGASSSKRKRSDSSRGTSKRRESKKSLSKRKLHSGSSSNTTTPVKSSSTPTETDKQSSNLRQWIENYEVAMTNHYSPELRARLHSLTKQMSSSSSGQSMLKNAGSLDNKCTTVPHAGAKILISTREIAPNNPVIEIRGKYMLSTQFKPQQQIGSPTSANGTRNFSKMQPGPFLFFYRLPNDGPEICVDTRTYGNEARFVRRSCRPNAELVHSIEKGTPHLYIVALNTIRSSTEITIKHEPHDLEALTRGEISAPTSTICGCGLLKDCLFGTNNSNPTTPQPSTPTSSKKSSKKPNGHVKDKSFSKHNKKSKFDKVTRSQTELLNASATGTNAGMLSPTSSKTNADDAESVKANETTSVKQSPQEKPPKDQHAEKPSEKVLRKNNHSVDGVWGSDQQQSDHLQKSPPVTDTVKTKDTPDSNSAHSSPSKSQQDSKFDGVQSRSMKSPPSTPISSSSLKSPSSKPVSHKKSTRKSTCSVSEDTGDEYSSKNDKDSKKTVENKKLTREERKMEAIVRAFEKMEKTEQRKNEQNKHKSGPSAHSSSVTSSNKKRSSSSFGKDSDGDKFKKISSQQGKRKRKRGKSYSQSSGHKRRRNRFDSNNSDDDGNTSDESNTPMLSPTRLHDLDRHHRSAHDSRDKGHSDNLAAGLLLSLSNYGNDKNTCLSSPERYSATNKSQSNTPPFAVSSACLLIEAAVGPLDNDFKLPTKAKTKKTIMNDWLHQSDGSSSFSSHNRLLSPSTSMDNYSHADSNTNSYSHDEPRNLSIAAQKIEEFIHLTSGEHIDDDECSKWSGSPICTSSDTMTVPTPMPTPPLQLGSSVKKRWLRQAISEECSDELLVSSATSSPPNGFMAPLKKRRVVRQCSDLNPEDMPSPKEDTKDLAIEDETSESASKEGIDKSLQDDDESKPWQDVDIKIESESELHQVKDEVDSTPKIEDEPKAETKVETKAEAKAETEVETEAAMIPAAEVAETKTKAPLTLIDVDKFEPIESDEDEEMCEQLDIKTEMEDSQDKSFDEDSYKREPVTEDSKSQEAMDIASSSDKIKNADEEFDIEEEKHEKLEKDDSLIASVLPKKEIEDIQQKLHSFHSENLMILQSRNKKRASRATTPTSMDEAPITNVSSKESLPSSSSSEHSSKSRKFSADEREYKREPLAKVQSEVETPYKQYQSTPVLASNSAPLNQSMTAASHTYSTYALNTARIEPNTSIPPPQNYPTPTVAAAAAAAAQNYANVNTPLSATIPPTNPMYHYLEAPNRAPGYTTGFNPTPMFSIHTNVPPPTLLNSSNYLTKNYSTLSEPSTPVANVPTPSVSSVVPSSSSSPMNPKVLQRTQSADPRLNPQKDLPPATPKRKLSINEYRKRKQLTTTSEKPKVDCSEKEEIPPETSKATEFEEKPKNGMAAVDTTTDTVFSPAPTLLEMQQENLSRRLMSYKSLHGLSSQIETIKSTETALENEISEALNASSCNSSLTSVSSPKSEQDFDDAEMNEPSPTPDEIKEEASTSDTTSCTNPIETHEEKMDIGENDFDLEPAEPPQNETLDSTDASV